MTCKPDNQPTKITPTAGRRSANGGQMWPTGRRIERRRPPMPAKPSARLPGRTRAKFKRTEAQTQAAANSMFGHLFLTQGARKYFNDARKRANDIVQICNREFV